MTNLAFLSNSWSHLLGRPTICLVATHSLLGNFYFPLFSRKFRSFSSAFPSSKIGRKFTVLGKQYFLISRDFLTFAEAKNPQVYRRVAHFECLSLCYLLKSLWKEKFPENSRFILRVLQNLNFRATQLFLSCLGDVTFNWFFMPDFAGNMIVKKSKSVKQIHHVSGKILIVAFCIRIFRPYSHFDAPSEC